MSPAEKLLAGLDGVRPAGPGRWSARCPAHEDRSPSLSVRELDDGRVLLHCFGGCEVSDVVAALGMRITELFPPRAPAVAGCRLPRERRPFALSDLVRLAAYESTVAALVAGDIARGVDADRARLITAAGRLGEVAGVLKNG